MYNYIQLWISLTTVSPLRYIYRVNALNFTSVHDHSRHTQCLPALTLAFVNGRTSDVKRLGLSINIQTTTASSRGTIQIAADSND